MYWSEIASIASALSTDVFDNVIHFLLYFNATFVITNYTCFMVLPESIYCTELYLWCVLESYCDWW